MRLSYLLFSASLNQRDGMDGTKGKGKGRRTTDHEGPEGEQRYSSTLSLTSALEGVGGRRHARPLYRRKRPGV